MPKGGARVNSGPPPDPNALRRDRREDKDGWTTLPAEGRKGKAPAWPLAPVGDDDRSEVAELVAAREAEVWKQIWSTPQAVAWGRLGWTYDVAVYVRLLVLGEQGSVKSLSEARQWSDRLGLNPAAMLRNRWRVAADEVGVKRTARAAAPARKSARDRLRALDGGGA